MRRNPIIISIKFKNLLAQKALTSRTIKILLHAINNVNTTYYRCPECRNGQNGYSQCQNPRCKLYGRDTEWAECHYPTRFLKEVIPGDYFSHREKKGLISYCPKGKVQEITEDGKWSLKNRIGAKPGSVVKMLLSEEAIRRFKIKDHEFADLATAVKHSELADDLRFEIVSFEDAYKDRKYRKDEYPDSCMWNEPVGEFYRAFGAECLVCIDGNGDYRARAVVWREVKAEGKKDRFTFMDRVYADCEEVGEGMLQYARSQGWYHKMYQSNGSLSSVIAPDGTSTTLYMRVKGSDDGPDFYPYCDTFASGDGDSLGNNEDGCYIYRNTGGTRENREDNHDDEVCDVDGNWIDADNAVEVNGDYYHDDDDRICYSNRCGRLLLREYSTYIESVDDWYPDDHRDICQNVDGESVLKKDCVRIGDDWYPDDSDDIVCLANGDYALLDDAVEIRNKWYLMDDSDVIKDVDGEYRLEEDCVEVEGKWYPEDDDRIEQCECGEWMVKPEYRNIRWVKEQRPLPGFINPVEEQEVK